jgi:hypothetical protein
VWEVTPPDPGRARGSREAALVVLAMIAMVVVPAALTLRTVRAPRPAVDPSTDPTPLGYTWSLLLYVVPLVVLAVWFLRHPRYTFQRRAFWITVAVLVPLGIALDLLFGTTLFVFPNRGAVLGIDVPAIGGSVPVEELVFYLAGFVFVLLLYVWCDEYWAGAYNVPDYAGESQTVGRLLRFDPRSLLAGSLLVAAALAYKKLLAEDREGFPLYFVYLTSAAVVPSASFYLSVRRFINWRAFSVTFFFTLLLSLMWEATLAIPYGWWGYNRRMMTGLFVDGWSGLPLEAVVVWLAVTYTTVIVFEVVKVWTASGKKARDAFLGRPAEPSPQNRSVSPKAARQ